MWALIIVGSDPQGFKDIYLFIKKISFFSVNCWFNHGLGLNPCTMLPKLAGVVILIIIIVIIMIIIVVVVVVIVIMAQLKWIFLFLGTKKFENKSIVEKRKTQQK